MGIGFQRDGSAVTLRLDLPNFPEHPPKKWVEQEANTVQIKLMLIDIQSLSLSGWGTETAVEFSLERKGELIQAAAMRKNERFEVLARGAFIQKISAYLSFPSREN